MDINLIQNIVFAILFAYFIITVFKSVVRLVEYLTAKLIVFLRTKKVMKEYTDYLKGDNDGK